MKGAANAAAAYDRTTQRYADLRAARDAEIRLARALSQEISLRLASATRRENAHEAPCAALRAHALA